MWLGIDQVAFVVGVQTRGYVQRPQCASPVVHRQTSCLVLML
jgi:hypothetical protein